MKAYIFVYNGYFMAEIAFVNRNVYTQIPPF